MRMTSSPHFLLAALTVLCLAALAAVSGPVSLFNGNDLTGWVAMHGGEWTVEGGVIVGRHGKDWSTNPEKSGSWIRTGREYGDFKLELEYSINERGNSGVFFHSALEKNPAFTGHEVQILDDHGHPATNHSTGSLYDVVGPTRNMSRPAGEWNKLLITTKGRQVGITLNGEKIIDHMSDRATRGYIGLQVHDEQAVVKFRNIRLTEG